MAGETTDGRVILALDQGTTSSRAIVFAADGARPRRSRSARSACSFPQPGWVEQDPLEIWTAQRETAVEALRSSGVGRATWPPSASPTSARPPIVWDRATSLPIAPAIVWQDRRTAERCEELRRAGHEALVRRKTGLLLDPYFSATKIALAPRHRARRARAGRARGARLRHGRQLAGVAAQRRPPARDRRHQRLAHAALRPAHRRLGRRAARALRRAAGAAARGVRHQRRRRRDRRRGLRRAAAAGGHGRRPAGRPLRPGLHGARHDQGHLRHRAASCSCTPARSPWSRRAAC